ncbi:type II toxin-antitoxin system antitoxin SocA domain-containing protein [Halogeometricum sp. CBA1124]|uniref:type II toxin-antitoxin system antitoxin SocA domain-containing protein n=1 Tax=Halogeometricum sp. CBA1124 TaxID=2668071 RepID=UPI00142C093B|nr:type II toxin-antitoxin system antitoxin SocA domain-containing protein [Halogeometricum sp. CBA1124]MUV57781.1 hypothetical protein [Halogeometricum sp. CBA1124]
MYTPNDDGVPQPIYGRTRIMKAMFLVQRKLKEEFGEDAGFDFEAYKYGPFDKGVYDALEDLIQKKLIHKIPAEDDSSPRDEPRYELTEKGQEEAKRLYEQLDMEKKRLLRWVRYQQAERPLGSLLSYVYRKYPDMAAESEISDRVIP